MNYSKQVYDKAWDILAERRRTARESAAARREEVRRRVPQIEAIERQMASQAASVARLVIANPQSAEGQIQALAEENLRLQQQRQELLVNSGYSADYLEERYTCSACNDAGYIAANMCGCMQSLLRREAAALLERSSPMRKCTFEGFLLHYYDDAPDESGASPRDKMRDKLSYCQMWASRFSPTSESILMVGSTGVGKTHLSVAMAGEAAGAGYDVVYTPVQRMMDALEGEKFSRDSLARQKYLGATDTYLDCDLLVLDDLGTEFTSSFTGAALFNILNTRLVEERPTIISTNLELADITARYNQRMASRLIYGYKVLRLDGKDIRYMKKMESSR